MTGGISLYLPLAGLAGLVVLGRVADGTRGWSKVTRQRLSATYFHFFVSTLIWSGTALSCWKLGLVPLSPVAPLVQSIVGMWLVWQLNRLDYDADRWRKVVTFHSFAALQGLFLSVLLFKCWELGLFDVVVQAAILTAAAVASVSLIVAASPGVNFMWLGGILGVGLGLLIGANLINILWSSSTVLHLGISYMGAGMMCKDLYVLSMTSMLDRAMPCAYTCPDSSMTSFF